MDSRAKNPNVLVDKCFDIFKVVVEKDMEIAP